MIGAREIRLDRAAGYGWLAVRPPYDLHRTLGCGQAFRWRIDAAGAAGTFAGRPVRLQQTADGIVVAGLPDAQGLSRLHHYLGLDEPLEAIERELAHDRVLRRLLPTTTGLALLHQDPWECLISFIISAFNNIPKIELSLDRLARQFGEQIAEQTWAFPTPERLAAASLPHLRRCALGYRAPSVQAVARRVATGSLDLQALEGAPYPQARRMLLALPGVGDKVADCVLLFGYRTGAAFPVDVWVKRAVERWYLGGRPRTERKIREFAQRRFGNRAGYAQQHLFYAIRGRHRTRANQTLDPAS